MAAIIITGTFGLAGAASAQAVPFFLIQAVDGDNSVTVFTYNLPPNQTFFVTMGPFGSQGFGTPVTSFNSGAGGSQSLNFTIPAAYRGSNRIAIRMQTNHTFPYFAYNWFYNNTAPVTTVPDQPQPEPPAASGPIYVGNPSFNITAVTRGQTVTVAARNFPPNQTFTVTMNGIAVESFNSEDGGDFTRTFSIPTQLAGYYRIPIRMSTSHSAPYFAFNWFYNNTTG
ncbi:MAG: hypothetical protein AAF633_03375 [Chloroflexota bacterium]